MLRSFRYQILPTKAQEHSLNEWFRRTCELYNAALQERRDAWKMQQVSVSCFDQNKQLPAIREARPEYNNIPISVLRGTLRQLDKSFGAFFRRCKSGEKPGFPRFKKSSRWSTLAIDDLGKKNPIVAGGKRLAIPLLGKIKLRLHRPIEGTPKSLRISLMNGRWYVSISCEGVAAKPLSTNDKSVGVDLGLLQFAATNDGQLFDNPRPLKAARLKMERAQRRVTRRRKGSKRRRAAVGLLQRKYAHVTNIRRENHILVSKNLVANYDTIFVEDLNMKGLTKSYLAKSIHDAGWSGFLHWLNVKAEEAGRKVVKVNPAGTSQICSGCLSEVRKDLSIRIHNCPTCGLSIDRDVNAACNILRLGLSLQGAALLVGRRHRSVKPKLTTSLENYSMVSVCEF